ncbi:hypothetical protein QBC32DRAFT_403453 [Pseudoneurospora amorphoporcata]|uniref:C2H2-type domain-containing protein n=1 Tax=Pseudoneurospora amorphoporcata TaxID=241081 RepID=A0AAN6P203_9PEZI|nr:hypothetical protein QBC32DRAFT_403453 [Pseudoneurospora amorphoporcata]
MDKTASKRPATMDKTTLRKCILAIDLGSSALRAAFVECEAPYTCHPIHNRDVQANRDAGAAVTCMGDFPVSCCPLDDDNPLGKIGVDAASEPGNVSAKYLMYILADVDDSVMADYPLPEGLMAMKEDAQLREDCETILGILFQRLKERVDDFAYRKRLCFDEIILTIPSQWDVRFEAIYESIVQEAFAYENEEGEKVKHEVHFCGEADALARGSGNSNMTFLELDSGGCAGGSEMWSHQVGLLIGKKLEEMGVADAGEKKKFQLLKNFNKEKSRFANQLGADGVTGIAGWDEHGTITTLSLPTEEVKHCFDTALERPFAMAKEQLIKLKGYSGDKKIGVVVAGGTLNSTIAREAVFAGSDIPGEQIKYTSEIDVTWLSSCNCHGAELAHAKKLTVAQFFEHGAVIAVQQKVGRGRKPEWEGAADTNKQDNTGKAGASAGSATNAADNNDSGSNTNVIIPMGDFYDLHYLGPQMAGRLIIKASLTSPSGTASPERTLRVSINRKSRRDAPEVKVRDINLPLCLDPGPNAVHVDIDALGPEERDEQAALRQREEAKSHPKRTVSELPQSAQAEEKTSDAPSEQKSATAKASRTKRKRKAADAAPAQPSKRPRTRAALGSDSELEKLPYDAPPVSRNKRKATAPASSTATKKARIDTSADRASTNNIPDNQPDEDLQGQLQGQLARESNAAQGGEQIEEQPQGRSHTQKVPQHNDEDTHVHTDDQLDNELHQNHEPAATANGNHTQPPTPPPYVCSTCQRTFGRVQELRRHSKLHTGEKPYTCPKCDMKFARKDHLAKHTRGPDGCAGRKEDFGNEDHNSVSTAGADESGLSNMYEGAAEGEPSAAEEERRSPDRNNSSLNVNGNTSRLTQNQTAENARGFTDTRARSHTPAANADGPATRYTDGRFAPTSSPPKSRRHRTEPPPERRGQPQVQPQPRRSPRQQKRKTPAVVPPAATRRQQQQQQPPQPQPQRQPAPAPPQPEQEQEQEARPQAGSSRVQAHAQAALQYLEAAETVERNQPQPRPSPTRQQVLAQAKTQAKRGQWRKAAEGNKEDEEKAEECITVKTSSTDPNRSLADQVADEDGAKEDKQDEEEKNDENDYGNGGGGGGDGDDDPSGRLFPSSREQERENQGRASSPILGEQRESSSRGRGSGDSNGRSSGSEDKAEAQVSILGPLSISRLQRTLQVEAARGSTSPQRARGGNRVVGAAERNKENRREQTAGTVTGAAAGVLTGEGSRCRPTREEKGKGKAIDKPASKPATARASRPNPHPLAPRGFFGQPSSAVASSSSSAPAPAIPNAAPPSKDNVNKGKGKGKAKPKAKQPATNATNTTYPPFALAPTSSPSSLPYQRFPAPAPNPAAKQAINNLFAPSIHTDLQRLIASTAPSPIADRPEPPRACTARRHSEHFVRKCFCVESWTGNGRGWDGSRAGAGRGR